MKAKVYKISLLVILPLFSFAAQGSPSRTAHDGLGILRARPPAALEAQVCEGCLQSAVGVSEDLRNLRQEIAIFGKDGRQVVPRLPGTSAGKVGLVMSLNVRDDDGKLTNDTGTGALVGECLVLTNAHVVVDQGFSYEKPVSGPTDLRLQTLDLRFAIGSGDLVGFAKSTKARIVAIGKYSGGRALTKEDWALLKLDDCYGREYGYFKLNPKSLSEISRRPRSITMISHPGDRDFKVGIAVEAGCTIYPREQSVTYQPEGTYSHDCASVPGASGSPLIQKNLHGEEEIVAMHYGAILGDAFARKYDPMGANLAVAVSAFYPQIRSFLPQ